MIAFVDVVLCKHASVSVANTKTILGHDRNLSMLVEDHCRTQLCVWSCAIFYSRGFPRVSPPSRFVIRRDNGLHGGQACTTLAERNGSPFAASHDLPGDDFAHKGTKHFKGVCTLVLSGRVKPGDIDIDG